MNSVKQVIAVGVLCTCGIGVGRETGEEDATEMDKSHAKAFYAIGMDMGNSIVGMSDELNLEIDVRALLQGIEDTVRKRRVLLTMEEARRAKMDLIGPAKKLRFELGEKNKKAGEEFLAANKSKEGVVTRESGLQYTVVREGGGENPGADDGVAVQYRGTLIDGTEFANTQSRGEPEKTSVKKVLPGLGEALQLMRVGAVWRVFIPAQLAYGARGRGRAILPHATLIYEIELVGIEPAKEPAEKEPESKKRPEPVALPVGGEKTEVEGEAKPEKRPER